MTSDARTQVLGTLDRFLQAWAGGEATTMLGTLAPDAIVRTSNHGTLEGSAAVVATLTSDFSEVRPDSITATNQYVAGSSVDVVVTSYIYGRFDGAAGPPSAVFGAVLLGDLQRSAEGWRITALTVDVSLVDGATDVLGDWSLPSPSGWMVGDPTPLIVSEVDSPWARVIPPLDDLTDAQRVSDAFARYAWAIDQGDITLLLSAYAPDVSGDFTPMGRRAGRREVIGQQKAFRRHWPVMQHFAVPLDITVSTDRRTASAVIGRVIPQQDTVDGVPAFGAHYRLAFLADGDDWRISHFDYRPGWITSGCR